MDAKRKPIRNRIQKIVLIIASTALLISVVVGIFTMLRIRSDSEDALIAQVRLDLSNLVAAKADDAELRLGKYMSYITESANYISGLYNDPDSFALNTVLPPDKSYGGKYSMQRYIVNDEVSIESITDELGLLGNLEHIWIPVMTQDGDSITTIYAGTENGFMICYDKNANLAAAEEGEESYFNYFNSDWYTKAKESGTAFFTDVYPDSYGRGLTVSCASPFYNNGKFAGTVCMDILVTDLHKAIIDLNISQNSYAFLVDNDGNIIASPDVSLRQTDFENIKDPANPVYEASEYILGGEEGIFRTSSGMYSAYSPINSTDWTLVVNIPESDVISAVKTIDSKILNALIGFLCVFVFLCIVVFFSTMRFSKKITNPIVCLQEDVAKITDGNLDWQAKQYTNDEIGDLAQSFNSMTSSLKKYIEDLTSVTAEKERIGAELDIASSIQLSMLPSIFPKFAKNAEYDVSAFMNPAKEVGGDFYDIFNVDDRHLALVVADVSGKGVPAALFMVIGKTLIKDHTKPDTDLGETFTLVNNMLCDSNSEGLFITAFECVLDLDTGEAVYVNAGHNPPVIMRDGQKSDFLKTRRGLVLAGMEGIKYHSGSFSLSAGDRLFLYTDGVTEATNTRNELYGDDRLLSFLDSCHTDSSESLCTELQKDIDQFVGEAPQFDDITMMSFKYFGKMN